MLQVIIHEKKLYHCIHKDSELQSSRGGLVVELWTDTDTFLITRIIGIQDCLHDNKPFNIIFTCDPNGQEIESINLIFLRSVSCLDIKLYCTFVVIHYISCAMYFVWLNKSV